jgi:tRNA A-37 threonylcarbamoyl transferase component Bud32
MAHVFTFDQPEFRAYVLSTRGGNKALFLRGGERVHRSQLPMHVEAQLSATLSANFSANQQSAPATFIQANAFGQRQAPLAAGGIYDDDVNDAYVYDEEGSGGDDDDDADADADADVAWGNDDMDIDDEAGREYDNLSKDDAFSILMGGAARKGKRTSARRTTRTRTRTRAMPRSIFEVLQQVPAGEAPMRTPFVHVRRASALGPAPSRQALAYRSAQAHDCRALVAKRGNKLLLPRARYDTCELTAKDFDTFAKFITANRGYIHPANVQGRTVCEKIVNLFPAFTSVAGSGEGQTKWHIVRHLGQGVFGSTFLAVNRQGQEAAVKVILETGQEKVKPTEEFELQRVFASMNLAPRVLNTASVLFRGTKFHVLMMERVEFTLYDLLCFQRLSPNTLQSIAYSLARFLWKMYEKGITHGDMHSQNIMFRYNKETKQYEPLLIDFGYATTQFNDPEVDALQLITDLSELTRMSPRVVDYLVKVLSKVVSRIRGRETVVAKRRSAWERHVDWFIARRGQAARAAQYAQL